MLFDDVELPGLYQRSVLFTQLEDVKTAVVIIEREGSAVGEIFQVIHLLPKKL